MGTDLNIGHVTAYAYAKSKGYTGTEEQFATELAQFAQNAQKVAEDKAAVEQLVDEFLNTTAPALIQDVTDEGTSQVERVAGAGTAQVTRVGEAGNTQIDAVAAAGTTQIGLVTAEGTTQVTRVQDKGDEVIDSIPADYTALTQEVSDLNRQLSDVEENQIPELKSDLNDLTKISISFAESGVLNKDIGTVGVNASYACTDFIEIKGLIGGIGYTVKTINTIAIACLYNEQKGFISSVVTNSSTLSEDTGVITDFEDAKYIRFCSYIENDYEPKLFCDSLENLSIYGSVVAQKNVTFASHDETTNLINKNNLSLGYINGAVDGSVKASTSMYVTDYIPLSPDKQYYFNSNYLYTGYCAFYSSDNVQGYISGYGSSSPSSRLTSTFTPPPNTKFGRFTIASQSRVADAWLCETNQMATKPADYNLKIDTRFIAEKPTDYKGTEISVFTKILCIGDSLTDGFFNESGGSRLIMRNRSFPAKLQSLTGVECTNMGYAGYTSAQWYTAYASEDLSGHDACIIQLGVNDQIQNVSESDMDAALTNIVNKVKTDNNGIKIFIATIIPANGYMTTAMRTRSQMIRDFIEALNDANVYLVDLWTYGHTDDYLTYDAGHLSALGYLRLAEDYKAYISYLIHNNSMDFRYVQFIGTNYTYNGDTYTRSISYD